MGEQHCNACENRNQQVPLSSLPSAPPKVRYEVYTGGGTGADGQCMSIGTNDMAGSNGEDGVPEGVALCFDEVSPRGPKSKFSVFCMSWLAEFCGAQWSNPGENGGDHGISIRYNGQVRARDVHTTSPGMRVHGGTFHTSRARDVRVTPALRLRVLVHTCPRARSGMIFRCVGSRVVHTGL